MQRRASPLLLATCPCFRLLLPAHLCACVPACLLLRLLLPAAKWRESYSDVTKREEIHLQEGLIDIPPRGGRLQPVMMRPTPQLSFKTSGGGGSGVGGSSWGWGGGEVFLPGVGGGGVWLSVEWSPVKTSCSPPKIGGNSPTK